MRRKRRISASQVLGVMTLVVMVAALICGVAWFAKKRLDGNVPFVPTTHELTFVRQLDNGDGQRSAMNLVSEDGNVQLNEVFSDENRKLYGPVREDGTYGAGLKVTLITHNGTKQYSEPVVFEMKGWTTREETSNPDRRRYVAKEATDFNKVAAEFTAPKPVKRIYAIAVDVTDGIPAKGSKLTPRVHELLMAAKDDWCQLGPTTVVAYHITQEADQSDRPQFDLCAADGVAQAETWLMKPRPEDTHSSIFGALHIVLADLATHASDAKTKVRADIVTDGLENTPTLSFYKLKGPVTKELVDQIFDPKGFTLPDAEIRFHPLPGETDHNRDITMQVLDILGNDVDDLHGTGKVLMR